MSRQRRPRVLITGGSIAGPALAWSLHREGFEAVVLERSPQRRAAGQNIDIRGLGHEILHRMGIHDAVTGSLTGEVGTRFVDESGRPFVEVSPEEGRDGPTAQVEILRGQLAGILLDLIADDVEVRYGDFVTAVDQDATGVDVTLDSGRRERFDLLLVAEGRSSRTRRLLFAEEARTVDKGVSIAYGTIDRRSADTDWWTWLSTTGGRSIAIRPDNVGTLRAHMSFLTPPFGFETLPSDAQIAILRERFRGVGWETDRVVDGFVARPEEFYTERMSQVIMPRWSAGRVALVGDAAWGSGPTGMGTTLSLVGSHVLAGELGRTLREPGATPAAAFARYEKLLRRYVDSAQGLPPGAPGILHPMTSTGVSIMRAFLRVTTSRPVRGIAEKNLLTSQKHVPVLPEYPRLRGRDTSVGVRS
ncbi:2-polyprenyl-6-methoxyphenol hydroxylase-like FAD-dependent oxidoreductase [Pseudonocardia sediminis]|uniref:2-polyprenyl-6-methoxyphenol hydroxylase-like FAD-dependent oxidoreductase n=1 Tax=Pseudonocardia sediminis TaxID=1397368 RepID=A0A4Q7UVM7_PSEST|nr:FAD-dependent monooxygenase [Pseudonocardia sediminis]RZT86037.1 2-polyprenyl-6-methoxyphenol hydroxylase-like FAD-dependent oxidoreductase [Pseudonocardia sediminis]